MFAISVYLPCYCKVNSENHLFHQGKVQPVVDQLSRGRLMVLGDFNSHPSSDYFQEWINSSEGLNFAFSWCSETT